MKRAVRTVIQIIAAALAIFGILEIGLEIAHHQIQVRNHADPVTTNIWHYVIGGVLLLVGMVLFAGSESLAEQLTDDIDDDAAGDETEDEE
jgi:drug/metabolite transporter (DMT)-like permease